MKSERVTKSGKIEIKCTLNRASLGNAEYVLAMIPNAKIYGNKVAWVPRKDITITKQALLGEELDALLAVELKNESEGVKVVSYVNSGSLELLELVC